MVETRSMARRGAGNPAQLSALGSSSNSSYQHSSNSMTNANSPILSATTTRLPDRLTALPAELKRSIFEFLFAPEDNIEDRERSRTYHFDMSLLAVSRTLGGEASSAFFKVVELIVVRHQFTDMRRANIPVLSEDQAAIHAIIQRQLHSMEVIMVDHAPNERPHEARETFVSIILSKDLDSFCKAFTFDLYGRSHSTMEGGTMKVTNGNRVITRQPGKAEVVSLSITLLSGPGESTKWNYKQKTFLEPFEQCQLPGINVQVTGPVEVEGQDNQDRPSDAELTDVLHTKMSPVTMSLEREAWKLLGRLSVLECVEKTFPPSTQPTHRRLLTFLRACDSWTFGIFTNLQPAHTYPPSLARPLTHAAVIMLDLSSTALVGVLRSAGWTVAKLLWDRMKPIRNFLKELPGGDNYVQLPVIEGKQQHIGLSYCYLLMIAFDAPVRVMLAGIPNFPTAMVVCEGLIKKLLEIEPERTEFVTFIDGLHAVGADIEELDAFNDGTMEGEELMERLGLKENEEFQPFITPSAYSFVVPEGLEI